MYFNALKKDCLIFSSTEIKKANQLQSTCDETQFQKDLGEARQRTSSPINFKSFVQNSMTVDGTEFQNCPRGPLPDLRG